MRIHVKKPITLFNKGVVIDLEPGFYHVKGAPSPDVISFHMPDEGMVDFSDRDKISKSLPQSRPSSEAKVEDPKKRGKK